MRSFVLVSSLFAAITALAGCGPVGVGSPCYYVGDTTGCVDGAMCTPVRTERINMGQDATWDEAVCRVICDSSSECATGEECRAVAGREMYSTCQPIEETP